MLLQVLEHLFYFILFYMCEQDNTTPRQLLQLFQTATDKIGILVPAANLMVWNATERSSQI